MNSIPLISVIIPVYGVEAYLDRCIESLVGQRYRNLQIILVDDGSPDRCPALCDAWAEKDERIQVIHKENGGVSEARNTGLKAARGEFIGFVDSDDWIDSNFFSVLYDALISTGSDLVECGSWETTGKTNIPDRYDLSAVTYTKEAAMKEHVMDTRFPAVVWNKLYRRELIDIPFQAGKYHEDLFWTYQIIERCELCASVPVRMYHHFVRPDSITGAPYSAKRVDCAQAFFERCVYLTEHYTELAIREQGRFIGQCIWQTQQLLLHPEEDPTGSNKKKLYQWACGMPSTWKQNCSTKQWLFNCLYLLTPIATCKLRNALKIGIE